jgi:hypothetical protein
MKFLVLTKINFKKFGFITQQTPMNITSVPIGFSLSESSKFPLDNSPNALVVPQLGQFIPVISRKGQIIGPSLNPLVFTEAK